MSEINPKDAPVDEAHVEGFIAGTLFSRDTERDRIFEALIALKPLNVDFIEYVPLQEVLKVIKRGLE